ncbi:hypothetical protein Ciccas_009334 [Cichlidogyrus casuarinus]|uniref:Uncharacterized protein n=1 Tax=Cichlidogyrus casuarinus TaxID=1844966 RepID=A0ABD2PXC4_9PLAT
MTSFLPADAELLDLIKLLVTDLVYEGEIGDQFQHAKRSRFEGGGCAPPSSRFPANYNKPLLSGRKRMDVEQDWEIAVVKSLPRNNSGYVFCPPAAAAPPVAQFYPPGVNNFYTYPNNWTH